MTRLMIVGDRIVMVVRDVDETTEAYWDRAWSLAAGLAAGDGARASWERSMRRPHENRGAVYAS